MATDHNFRIKNGLEVGGQLIVDSNGQLVVSAAGANLEFPDNTKLFFGTGSDASVFYDGSHLRFNVSSGNFNIQANDFHITDKDNGAARFTVDHNGATSIKYNANEKLATIDEGIRITGEMRINDANTIIEEGNSNSVRVQTNSGYIDIGPHNTSWAHIETDRARYYFNKGITVNTGLIGSYDEDLQIQRAGTTKLTVTATGVDIAGDLTITGDLNTVNTTTLDVSDKLITAGVGGTAATNSGGGFKISGANAEFLWDNTNTQMTLNKDLKFTSNQKLRFGDNWFANSGDNNHVHFYAAHGLIPHSTTSADNAKLGTASYRWEGVYAGIGDYSSYVQIGTSSGVAFNGDSSLRIQRAGNAYVNIKTGTSNAGGVLIGDTDDNFMGGFIYYNNTNKLELHANNGVALTIDDSKDVTFVANATASGYLQAHSYLYTRDNLRVLNNAGDGWNTWATRSSGNYDLNVGSVTSTGFSGPGSSITAINASNISSGTLPVARLSDNIFDSYNRGTIDVAGEDFDDYTTTGVHHVANWSDENDTVANGPTGSYAWGMLRVTNWMNNAGTGDGYVLQEYFPHNTDTCWTRIMWNSSWGGWRESWGSGSDGAGSGLDADKLDGKDTSSSGGNNKVIITDGSGNTSLGSGTLTAGTISSGAITSSGAVSAEDNIYLTDAGTVRGKLLLNASDRDNVELRAESLGSTMKFFTVGTQALLLDASQDATFAGTISSGAITSTGSSSLGDETTIGSIEFDGSGIGNQEAGLIFQPNSAYRCIHPTSMTATSHTSDISLGWSNNKWKDIYLAGFVKADSGYQVGNETVIDSNGNLTNIGTISSGVITATQININSGTTNTAAVFSSGDDKAFIRIKDDDTDTYLISKDNKFSIGESSSDYDNFKIDITSGDINSNGYISAGETSGTSGGLVLASRYSGDDHIATISSMYSNGGWVLGYGAKAKNGASGFVSTFDNFSGARSYLRIQNSAIAIGYAPNQQTAVDSDLTSVSEPFVFTPSSGALSITGQLTASTVNTGQGATEVHLMNQNLRTSDSPQFASLTLTGDLNITGDINTTTVTDLDVQDKTITVASGAASSSAADNAGLIIGGAGSKILWDHAEDKFQFSHGINFDRDTATTTNANLGIYWSAWDKEGTTDYSDLAWVRHTTNLQGYSTALEIKSNNDANDGIVFTTHSGSYLLHNSNKIFTDAYHPNADKWTTPRTLTLAGDLSGNVTFDGSANFTLTAAVANDSHTHAFDNLTAKGSGTGEYSTSGYLTAGRGSGGVSLTHNDGYGNANVTFNHKGGIPEQNGNSGRIVVNTDAADGDAKMSFELLSSVTSGTAVNTPSAAELTETGFYIPNYLYHMGDENTYLKFDTDRIRLYAGGAVKFDSDTTYLTTVPNHSASLITSGTLNTARLPTDMILTAAAPRYRLNETGVTNTPSWWMISDGGNYSIRLNNTGTYPLQIATNNDNNAVTNIIMGYNTDFNDGIDVTGSATINCGTAIGLKIDHDTFAKGLELHREDSSNAASITFSNNAGESGILYARHSDKRPIWRPGGTGDNHEIFTDNYHPNADKWTTPRTHTVELTGEVTGSAAQTIDGSGNKTWSIATTVNNTSLDDQYVDITGDTMTGTLNMNSNSIQNARLSGSQTYLPGHAYSLTHDGSNVYWHIGSAAGSTNKVLNLRIYNSSNSYVVNTWTVDRLTVAGGVTATGDIIAKSSSNIIIGQYSTTDTGTLILTGSTANKQAELKCTNGNLHLDSEAANSTYINYYEGTGGVAFGTGASGVAAWMGPDGDLWKGSSDNNGDRYFNDGYHPNADKWTTARSHTVTLTGEVTGTATQSVDGTGNKTWSIATTLGNTALDDQYVDVTGDSMSGQLIIDSGEANPLELKRSSQVGIEFNDTSVGSRYLGVNGGNLFFGGNLNHANNAKVFHDTYHPNADKWTTSRTLTLAGDLSGNVSFDGSANFTLTAAVSNDSHNHNHSDGDFTVNGGLVVEGSKDSGADDFGYYQSAGTNIILKGDASGRSGIFFESEKNGTNINDPSDYGFIQFHSYGYGGSSGESIDMVIGTANDSDDHVIIQSPYNGGVKVGYKDATSGTGLTTQTIFHDAYHPNADKWTTSRTLTLAGDLSGNVSFDGSANFTLTAAVADDSHNHKKIVEDAVIDFGASKLQWMDQAGNGGTGLDGAAPRNPADGWYHNIITNHGNNNGYYSQISLGINTDDMYFGRVGNGSAYAFQRVFMDNYHPNADKWTTDRAFLINLTGAVTGNATVQVDGSSNETWTISTSLASGDFGSANIATSGYIETNAYYHDGDGNTGMVFPGVDQIDVIAGGTTMIRCRQEDTNADYISMFGASNSGEFLFYDNGNFHADANITAYSSNTTSDIRLKKNVRPLENCLDKVLGLDGVIFDWKKESRGKDQVGFIAQQVEEHAPELVSIGEDKDIGEVKTISYDGVIPMLVESIKELKAEIDDLKEQLKNK